MDAIRLIVVPYEVGRERDGVGRGPEHLLQHGARGALGSSGAEVHTSVVELHEPQSDEIDASFELIRRTAKATSAAVAAGEFPVVLSGSCAYAALGLITGLGERSPGVIWFDAHGGFNSPDTAVYGYFDGMGVAVLTGSAWQGMLATVEGASPIPETSVLHVGGRDFDPPEVPRLAASQINVIDVAGVRKGGLSSSVAALSPEPSGLYVHVDLDVLDGDETPVNIYSAPDGLSADELRAAVDATLGSGPIRGFSLTAYDPACDPDDAVPPVAVSLLERLARRLAADG